MLEGSQQSKRKLRIFLCHSKEDKPKVRELYKRLNNDGFQPWLDEEDLLPGQEWEMEIPKAVRESDVVIVCLSCTSVNKTGYVQKEIKFALDVADMQPEGKIFIIPARLEECKVPERLSRWQWVDYYKDNGYDKLVNGLRVCAQNIGIEKPEIFQPFKPSFTISGMEFVLVPKGNFLMGSRDDSPDAYDDEKPQHTIDLPDYYIGRFQVTVRQFNEFIQATQYKHQWTKDWEKQSDHPVVEVSWNDTMAFCQWLNLKHKKEIPHGLVLSLPTEAEWEKAARGEYGREFPWSEEFDKNYCNTWEGGKSGTTPVGTYSPQGNCTKLKGP